MNGKIELYTKYLDGFVSDKEIEAILPEVEKAHMLLEKKEGPGKDFLGWMDLPQDMDEVLIADIEGTARSIRAKTDAVVVVGIGGSYLGARAVIEALAPGVIGNNIFFAGFNLSGEYLSRLMDELKDRELVINVISKSGTTTESAVAFRILEKFLEDKYGPEEMAGRIVCTTDSKKGALKAIADKKGYKTFVVPDDVGGRFSVLTPVGLFPIACSGLNIRELLKGAKAGREESSKYDPVSNLSYRYAAIRNILYRKGKKIEILAEFDHRLRYVDEWWKQLFGESEGKGGKGIFPASCDFSTDLHSIGQLIQDGERNIFETFLIVKEQKKSCVIPESEANLDNLNYLAGKDMDQVNSISYEATSEAHFEGGVPNMTVFIPELSTFYIGQLFYFFEKAVAVSGYISGVNPFDQPGVEAYKNKMFKLLGKPGS